MLAAVLSNWGSTGERQQHKVIVAVWVFDELLVAKNEGDRENGEKQERKRSRGQGGFPVIGGYATVYYDNDLVYPFTVGCYRSLWCGYIVCNQTALQSAPAP